MNKEEPRRKLTDKEIEHTARLLRRCSQVQLAALLGISNSTVSGGLRGKTLALTVIDKLAQLTTDDVPARPKPKINRAFARFARHDLPPGQQILIIAP
jgi:transcriptional regulator with XRE-family HTH domain